MPGASLGAPPSSWSQAMPGKPTLLQRSTVCRCRMCLTLRCAGLAQERDLQWFACIQRKQMRSVLC